MPSLQAKLSPQYISDWASQRVFIPANIKRKAFLRAAGAWFAFGPAGSRNVISPSYAALNQELHERNKIYGTSGSKWAPKVHELAKILNTKEVLDYGCGKQTLAKALADTDLTIKGYDPALPGMRKQPKPCDIVVCTDVLEHVEPELIDNVLDDIRRCTRKAAIVTVATRPANKFLADGRNAHLTVQPLNWWINRFETRFTVAEVCELPGFEFALLLQPLGASKLSLNLSDVL
jgi:hypothetical protein